MNLVPSLDEAIRSQIHESTNRAADTYRSSIRAVYGSPNGVRPEIIGSCFLFEIKGEKFVVTAAHIADWVETHGLFIAGTVGTEPVQIDGEIIMTKAPNEGRHFDKKDFSFWQVPPSEATKLGDVKFITSADISRNQVLSNNRMYLAMGFPISRNKRGVNNNTQTIKTKLWKYTAEVAELPKLADELNISGKNHFFLKFGKYSSDAKGKKVSSGNPQGVSGGVLIDLGDFSSPEVFTRSDSGKLCGMIIEKNNKHRALVAVKIEIILEAIRNYMRSNK